MNVVNNYIKYGLVIFLTICSIFFGCNTNEKIQSCSYFHNEKINLDDVKSIYEFSNKSEAQNLVDSILNEIGLSGNFIVSENSTVSNAAAVIYGNDRFILYNHNFIKISKSITNNSWVPLSILAHEIGHHLQGHTLDDKGSRPSLELEADKFSGFILGKMGASLQDAQTAIATLASSIATKSHPSKIDRLDAIAEGFQNALDENSIKKNKVEPSASKKQSQRSLVKPSSVDNMVFVEGGVFNMGSNKNFQDEKPSHKVKLDGFYIDKYEVSFKEFKEFIDATGYLTECEKNGEGFVLGKSSIQRKNGVSWKHDVYGYHNKCQSYPVLRISYFDAISYANWIGKRLPTEAEWEFAAKGGIRSKNYKYSGGNDLKKVGRSWQNSGGDVSKIGSFIPNELGIYDMTGNVTEWCSDVYDENYYRNSQYYNPQGPKSKDEFGKQRIQRGGYSHRFQNDNRLTYRGFNYRSGSAHKLYSGFRLVKDVN